MTNNQTSTINGFEGNVEGDSVSWLPIKSIWQCIFWWWGHIEGTWIFFLKSFHLLSATGLTSALHPALFTSYTLYIICTKILGKYYVNSMFLFIWFYFTLDNNDTNGFGSLSVCPILDCSLMTSTAVTAIWLFEVFWAALPNHIEYHTRNKAILGSLDPIAETSFGV